MKQSEKKLMQYPQRSVETKLDSDIYIYIYIKIDS